VRPSRGRSSERLCASVARAGRSVSRPRKWDVRAGERRFALGDGFWRCLANAAGTDAGPLPRAPRQANCWGPYMGDVHLMDLDGSNRSVAGSGARSARLADRPATTSPARRHSGRNRRTRSYRSTPCAHRTVLEVGGQNGPGQLGEGDAKGAIAGQDELAVAEPAAVRRGWANAWASRSKKAVKQAALAAAARSASRRGRRGRDAARSIDSARRRYDGLADVGRRASLILGRPSSSDRPPA